MFKIFKGKDRDCCGVVIKEVQEGKQEEANSEAACCTEAKAAKDNCCTNELEQSCC